MATSLNEGSAESPSSDEGAMLFVTKGCAACHSAPDRPAVIDIGPDLSFVPPSRDYIRRSITDPAADIAPGYRSTGGPGRGMPDLGLSDAEVDALVDFLLNE